jgi:hypothetical protein
MSCALPDFDPIPIEDVLLGLTFRLFIALHHMRRRRHVPLAVQDVFPVIKHANHIPPTEPSPKRNLLRGSGRAINHVNKDRLTERPPRVLAHRFGRREV